MKLHLTITDERVKRQSYSAEREDYDRVVVDALDADSTIIANTLRAIADDIAPHKVEVAAPVINVTGSTEDMAARIADAIRRGPTSTGGDFR